MTVARIVLRFLLSAMLAVSVFEKLLHPQTAALAYSSITTSPLMQRTLLAGQTGWEAYLAVALLFGQSRLAALMIVATLLLYSGALVWIASKQGWATACHCLGRIWQTSVGIAILRNLTAVFLVVALLCRRALDATDGNTLKGGQV